MWRELAAELGLGTTEPALEEAIRAAEAVVGCQLPASLRDLLLQTNGVSGEYELEVVFSAERIAEENLGMRTQEGLKELYMPFEPLLFFGAAGNGDLFAFAICGGEARDDYVFIWDNEDDSRATTSASLERYLRGENWYEERP